MQTKSSDPDLETLVNRIQNNDVILQPSFQRNIVWNTKKQPSLIDTILRGWHIPPVHMVVKEDTGVLEVLDGQQRLTAIDKFFSDKLTIDAHIDPETSEVKGFHGLRFSELPDSAKRKICQYTLRQITITDYTAAETAELFYRLNQSTTLTPAEQRNAYFGAARSQINTLSQQLYKLKNIQNGLSFSNARFGYNDVTARICLTIEANTLAHNITSDNITEFYKKQFSFSDEVLSTAKKSFFELNTALTHSNLFDFKIGKASLLSWIFFLIALPKYNCQFTADAVAAFIGSVEERRKIINGQSTQRHLLLEGLEHSEEVDVLLSVFNKKASTRPSDAASILIRDLILHVLFYSHFNKNLEISLNQYFEQLVSKLNTVTYSAQNQLEKISNTELILSEYIEHTNWGDLK